VLLNLGAEKCIYELIKRGGVVNATNYLGSTPLHYACQRGHHKAAVSFNMDSKIHKAENSYLYNDKHFKIPNFC